MDQSPPPGTVAEPSTQSALAKEIALKYPSLYREFHGRVDYFVQSLRDYEELVRKTSGNGSAEMIPPEQRDEVFNKIGDGFKEFVLRTREASIRAAEAQAYDSPQEQLAQVARAMGAFTTNIISPGTAGVVPDEIMSLTETLKTAVSQNNIAQFLHEVYLEHGVSNQFNKLKSLPPESRSIRHVGLLLATRLNPVVSSAIYTLAERDGITTTTGAKTIDVANNILTSAGAKPYSPTVAPRA